MNHVWKEVISGLLMPAVENSQVDNIKCNARPYRILYNFHIKILWIKLFWTNKCWNILCLSKNKLFQKFLDEQYFVWISKFSSLALLKILIKNLFFAVNFCYTKAGMRKVRTSPYCWAYRFPFLAPKSSLSCSCIFLSCLSFSVWCL